MTNEDIQRIFMQECEEGLGVAEASLIAIQAGDRESETINSIFRAVHSIKGGAGAFGFTALQQFSHRFETVLQQVRDGDRSLDDGLVACLFRAFDTLADHAAAIRGERDTPDDTAVSEELDRVAESTDALATAAEVAVAEIAAEPDAPAAGSPDDDFGFDDLLGSLDDVDPVAVADWIVRFKPNAGALANGGEPLLQLRDLTSLAPDAEVIIDLSAVPDIDDFNAEGSYFAWTVRLDGSVARSAIEDLFEFIRDDCELSIVREGESCAVPAESADHPSDEVVSAAPVESLVVAEALVTAPAAAPEEAPAVCPDQTTPGATEQPKSDAPRSANAQAAPQAIRVDLDKLDRLVNTVGELVITQAMIAQRLQGVGADADDELAQLDYLTRELQDCAMSLRAQPIRSVFSRVPRIVREVEAETGKRVRLEVEGESTELDKTVIERIGEPLTHMIRNAVDHGLETPQERLAAGKPEEGRVRLAAEHRGGRILISVTDDGRGINREKVLEKARERGIVGPDQKLSDEEIDNLIFAPGFSTAEKVSNISGRGVGMDVVRQGVTALGGRISIASRPGEGSTFTLALPLTLAIADGMIVSIGDQLLVLPLTHVTECLRPGEDEVQSFGPGSSMLNIRGQFLPVLPLGKILSIEGGITDPKDAVLVVVETESRGGVVLMVDAIRDQRQVVIKSLETHYRSIEGLAGATILGDGRVALIIDAESLTEKLQLSKLQNAA